MPYLAFWISKTFGETTETQSWVSDFLSELTQLPERLMKLRERVLNSSVYRLHQESWSTGFINKHKKRKLPCPSSSSSVPTPWSLRSSPSVFSSWRSREASSHSCQPPLPQPGPQPASEASPSPFSWGPCGRGLRLATLVWFLHVSYCCSSKQKQQWKNHPHCGCWNSLNRLKMVWHYFLHKSFH